MEGIVHSACRPIFLLVGLIAIACVAQAQSTNDEVAPEVERLSTMNEIPGALSRLIDDLSESPVKLKIEEILLCRDARVLDGAPFVVSLHELVDVFRMRIVTATVRTYGLKEILDVLRAWGEKGDDELIAWHVISASGDFSLYESKAGEVVGAVAVDGKV